MSVYADIVGNIISNGEGEVAAVMDNSQFFIKKSTSPPFFCTFANESEEMESNGIQL